MIRNGHKLNKQTLTAYWLALNDQLEREVLEAPSTTKELEKAIPILEDGLRNAPGGQDRIDIALEIARGTP